MKAVSFVTALLVAIPAALLIPGEKIFAADDLTSAVHPASRLAAWWRFDEGSGTIAKDSSANARTLQLHGGIGFTKGKEGAALDFPDFRERYARRDRNDALFDFGDRDFVIEFNCNFRAFAHEQVLIEKFSAQRGPGWTVSLLEKNKLLFYGDGVGAFIAAVRFQPGRWYHIAISRRGATLNFSVDGKIIFSRPIKGAINPSANPLLLGRRNDEDGRYLPLNGALDEVKIEVVPVRRDRAPGSAGR